MVTFLCEKKTNQSKSGCEGTVISKAKDLSCCLLGLSVIKWESVVMDLDDLGSTKPGSDMDVVVMWNKSKFNEKWYLMPLLTVNSFVLKLLSSVVFVIWL